MADIQFYQEDTEDGPDDEGEDYNNDSEYEESNPDEGLSHIQKIEKYMCSENIYSRQVCARNLPETIRLLREENKDTEPVLRVMVKLAEDTEPSVRTEVMEQVPHIAMFCHEYPELFIDPIPTYILPVIVKYLMDINNLVRKTSQAALLVLMEQGLIDNVSIEEHVCPVINELSCPESLDDFRTEAVALMSKMAPMVGRDITERLFMPRFTEMCTDALFHVRKVCAANFGDVCSVVGQENTEKYLLSKFYYLCEDGVWGVRKACAECFTQVSCACSQNIRRTDLTPLFVGLVCDQSRWVRMAAFQCLGSFISTFADSSVTGLYFDEEGVLTVGCPDDFKHSEELTALDIEAGIVIENRNNDEHTSLSAPLAAEDLNLTPEDMEIDDCDDTTDVKPPPPSVHAGGDASSSDVTNLQQSVTSEDVRPGSLEQSPEELRAATQYNKQSADTDSSSVSIPDTALSSSNDGDVTAASQVVTVTDMTSSSNNSSDTEEQIGNNINNSNLKHSDPSVSKTEKKHNDSIAIEKLENVTADADPWSDSNVGGAQSKKSDLNLDLINESSTTTKCDTPIPSEITSSATTSFDVQSPESFSSFMYWRDPLPEINIESVLSPDTAGNDNNLSTVIATNNDKKGTGDSKEVCGDSTAVASNDIVIDILQSDESKLEDFQLEDPTNLAELDRFLEDIEGEKKSEQQGALHVANENVISPLGETVTNIGSVHVLGEQVAQHTMIVSDGVVTDLGNTSNLSYYPIDETSQHSSLHSLHESVFAQLSFYIQDVIPQELLDHYLSMTDPSRAQSVDAEIAKHCAYSFPAVAYTLGRQNWNCLRDLYDSLAGDMQWKVRRTLAFSIHELALILGEEITTRDLVPIFNGFLRDLDEVRIGVLKHFSDFIRLLSYKTRREYLPKISEFLNTDNHRNWRFRDDLAQQLVVVLELYTAEDIAESIAPVAFQLCTDGVSAVRFSAFHVVSGILRKFSELGDRQLPITFVNDIVGRFAHNPKWNMRQYYAQVCASILEQRALADDKFATDMLPSLLALGSDSVANVRITLAKTLCGYVLVTDYLTSAQNPHHESLLSTVQQLKSDSDRDVRYFITYHQTHTHIADIDSVNIFHFFERTIDLNDDE